MFSAPIGWVVPAVDTTLLGDDSLTSEQICVPHRLAVAIGVVGLSGYTSGSRPPSTAIFWPLM